MHYGNGPIIIVRMLDPSKIQQKQFGDCGVANIPNQIHYYASKERINFNILLMGEMSCGKTSFINRVLGDQVFVNDSRQFLQSNDNKVHVRVRVQDIIEDGIKSTIRLIDAPLTGFSISKDEAYSALINFTKDKLDEFLFNEKSINRFKNQFTDERVHVCLFFVGSKQKNLSSVELKHISQISTLTNVLIVCDKADMMTVEELENQRSEIQKQIYNSNINLFSEVNVFPISIRDHFKNRENLEQLFIRKYMPKLLDLCEKEIYEQFRASLSSSNFDQDLSLKVASLAI